MPPSVYLLGLQAEHQAIRQACLISELMLYDRSKQQLALFLSCNWIYNQKDLYMIDPRFVLLVHIDFWIRERFRRYQNTSGFQSLQIVRLIQGGFTFEEYKNLLNNICVCVCVCVCLNVHRFSTY